MGNRLVESNLSLFRLSGVQAPQANPGWAGSENLPSSAIAEGFSTPEVDTSTGERLAIAVLGAGAHGAPRFCTLLI
jgi:hypothetical protein